MSLYVEDYIARSMKKLRDSGQLNNDKFKGKPIDLNDYFRSSKDSRAINRYLADAGFTPPKVELLNQIKALEKAYRNDPNIETAQAINRLKLKYNTLR